ncbi:MAG: hypothetical protein DRQ88_07650 [Epsilonproteobacteria bacterium]|nr:MAG: hypothetical protein DRQ89_09445 [Campylobacterota bacterium]RLA66129.1 MAG: hypothetical protein DRQ88_07650 [Campylobacterota bacterium]
MSLKYNVFLTFTLALFSLGENFAFAEGLLVQKQMKRNLRWDINVPKNSVVIDKKRNSVFFKSISPKIFNTLSEELTALSLNKDYILGIKVHAPIHKKANPSIEVKLSGKAIEIFSFYRERQKKFILDFWINEEMISPDIKPVKIITKKYKTRPSRKIASVKPPKKAPVLKISDTNYRDFRYGASFIWNYPAISLAPPKALNLKRKTPDFFYPITDRTSIKDEREAHLQLSINLYRKRKFGLMKKSIDLYRKKYGPDSEVDFNEYLEANAFLKLNLEQEDSEAAKYALNMLKNIYKRTDRYPLKRAILKYLTGLYMAEKDYVNAVESAKQLYFYSKKYSDIEVTRFSAKTLLYLVTEFWQKEKVKKITADSEFSKFFSAQEMLAVKTTLLLKENDSYKTIKLFEKNRRSLADPIHEAILFNVAESYFREGKFKKSFKLFKKFIKYYSFHKVSSKARLRIALSHELMGGNPEETIKLYKNAIDRSSDYTSSLEARIRYVGIRTVRKKELNEDDLETRAFLKVRDREDEFLTQNLKNLLWLTRLRTFIVDKDFNKALAYLEVIPLESLKPSKRRVFMADGAEVTNGLIRKYFHKEEYRKLILLYEKHKGDYEKNTAPDPLMSYFVGKALVNLGFYKIFDQVYDHFKKIENKPKRSFPIWIERGKGFYPEKYLLDLRITKNLKLKNDQEARNLIVEYEKKYPRDNKANFFKGIMAYSQNKYLSSIKYLEKYLSKKTDERGHSSSEIASLLKSYTDSLYKKGFIEKFKKVSKALLKDTKRTSKENKDLKAVKEWIKYINIELLAADKDLKKLELAVVSFLKDFNKSSYLERIKYVLGVTYVEGNQLEKGQGIFEELVEAESTSSYIKELARSEISLINIKSKTL